MSKKIETVSVRDVKGGVILDVRSPAEFETFHAPGSVLHPLDRLDAERVRAEAGGQDIFLMCLGGTRAAKAAERLDQAGVGSLKVIEGGMKAWEAAGLPVERGERKVIPIERQARIFMGGLALVGSLLAIFVNPAWGFLSAFAGAGLVFSGITDWCGLGLILARMPWNQSQTDCSCSAGSGRAEA